MDVALNSLHKQNPEQIIKTLNSLEQLINGEDFNEEITVDQLNKLLVLFKQPQPSIVQATANVIKSILTTDYPSQFPTLILTSLIDPLSNKKTADIASSLVENLTPIMGSDLVWSILNKHLTTKNLKTILIISILNILCSILNETPNFRGQKLLTEIKDCVNHPSIDVRNNAINVIQIMFNQNPIDTKNSILHLFPKKSKEILLKIGEQIRKSPVKTPKPINDESKSDIIHGIALDFENAGDDIEPINSKERLVDFAEKLAPNKKNDWEDRLSIMNKIVGMAKATDDTKRFAKELFMIANEIAQCATDLRSGLARPSCINIVALARILRVHMDPCCEVLIPALLSKTSHGTLVIAESARQAVIGLVEAVPGKRTQKQVEQGLKSSSREARAATVEAVIAAVAAWPSKMQINLVALLEKAKADKDSVVRKLAAGALATKTPRRSEMISSLVAAKYPAQVTPSATLSGLGLATPSRMTTPSRRVRLEGPKTATRPSALRSLEGETPTKASRHPLKYLTLDTAIAGGAEDLADFLEGSLESIFGYTKDCIDLLIKEMNKPDNIAPRLAHIIFANYADFTFPFLTDIVDFLPDDVATGRRVIGEMVAVFGAPVRALLARSIRPYAYEGILDNEEAIVSCVGNGCYRENSREVLEFICALYEQEEERMKKGGGEEKEGNRAVALLAAMDREMRLPVIIDLQTKEPKLAAMFDQEQLSRQTIGKLLQLYNEIDYEEVTTMIEAGQPAAVLIKLVGIIGRSPFRPEAIAVLMYLMDMEDGALRAYAGKVLRRLLKENDGYDCIDISCVLSATASGFRCFLPLIKKFGEDDVAEALEEVRPQMIASLEIEETRIAVVEVVAALVAKFGREYEEFLGRLEGDNLTTLNFFLKNKYDIDEQTVDEISIDESSISLNISLNDDGEMEAIEDDETKADFDESLESINTEALTDGGEAQNSSEIPVEVLETEGDSDSGLEEEEESEPVPFYVDKQLELDEGRPSSEVMVDPNMNEVTTESSSVIFPVDSSSKFEEN